MNIKNLSPEQQETVANYVQKFYPVEFAYYAERGRIKNNDTQMGGFWDFARDAGNFVTGFLGENVNKMYQEAVNYQNTGSGGANAAVSNSQTANQLLMMQQQMQQMNMNMIEQQRVATEKANADAKQTQTIMMVAGGGVLAILAFTMLKK